MTSEQYSVITLALAGQMIEQQDNIRKHDYTSETMLEIIGRIKKLDRVHTELIQEWRKAGKE